MLRYTYIACLVNLGTLWRWVVNCFAPGEGAPVSLRIGGCVGSRDCLDVLEKIKMCWYCRRTGRDRSVGRATRYGLDGPGIESRLGRDFPYPSRPSLGATHYLLQWVPGIFAGRKAAEAWRWPPTLSSAKAKKGAGLYLLFPSRPSWPVRGWNLPSSAGSQTACMIVKLQYVTSVRNGHNEGHLRVYY
jgi:hypothetical protein